MPTYYSLFKGIRDGLKSVIEGVTWLSGKVYVNQWRTDTVFPCVLIETVEDNIALENVSPPTYELKPTFNLILRVNSTDMDILVSGVGAIIDKIRDYATNYVSGGLGWEKMSVGRVDYTYQSPGIPSAVIREASIPVIAVKEY